MSAFLHQAGVPFRVHHHVAVATIEAARAEVAWLTAGLLKTVVFEVAGTARRVLVAIDCQRQVDYRKLSAVLGCSRRRLRLVPAARVAVEFGMPPGGLGPFPLRDDVEVIMDADFRPEAIIKVAGGNPTVTLELEFAELACASCAMITDVSRHAP